MLRARVPPACDGYRFDRALCALFPEYSRNRLQRWIRAGLATAGGRPRRARDPVRTGEAVQVRVPEEAAVGAAPEAIPLDLIYQDADLLVVNKPPGLVVHPGAGNYDGTLVNALLHLDPGLEAVPRAGIVHRIDKDTSGLLIVARNLTAHHRLVRLLGRRAIKRRYIAVVIGIPSTGRRIEAPIGRHPHHRVRMAVVAAGRPAATLFRVRERFRGHAALEVALETGRTHQIRVHLAHIGYPLVGDPVYGGRLRIPPGAGDELGAALREFPRQALHAERLSFVHPGDGRHLDLRAPQPEDLRALLLDLRADRDRPRG